MYHPFMVKALNKVGIEGMYLSLVKANQPIASIIFNVTSFSKIRNKNRMSTLTTSLQHSTKNSNQSN